LETGLNNEKMKKTREEKEAAWLERINQEEKRRVDVTIKKYIRCAKEMGMSVEEASTLVSTRWEEVSYFSNTIYPQSREK
jgi:DNA-binding transcriptional regulator YhcF (GntR family)